MTSIALLVVNYRSSALALEAIRTARAATSRPLQVVAVRRLIFRFRMAPQGHLTSSFRDGQIRMQRGNRSPAPIPPA